MLQLMGIDEPHKILSSQEGSTMDLSVRLFLHMLLVRQTNIARESSILINPEAGNNAQTSSPAALLFLLTGQDANNIPTKEDKKIRKAQRDAVIGYIRSSLDHISSQREELQLHQQCDEWEIASSITSIETKIDEVQTQIDEAIFQSKSLMDSIYEQNSKLSECSTIREQFATLCSQYESDIRRMTFIVEGQNILRNVPPKRYCPFCDSEITGQESPSVIEGVKGNLVHIRSHLHELDIAERDIKVKERKIIATVAELEKKKETIDFHIDNELRPQISALKDRLFAYKAAIQFSQTMEILHQEEVRYKAELFERENEEEPERPKYMINENYTLDLIQGFENWIVKILKASNFSHFDSAHFSLESFDIEFGSRKKSGTMGGGYCGIINTIIVLALMEYLIANGTYAPGLLIVDSPLTQLSESEYKEYAETIKQGFIDYLLQRNTPGQIILVEQKEKMPDIIKNMCQQNEQNSVHIIEFTKDRKHGRYGLLPEVYE